jgi:hypothetical protein
VSEYLGPKWGLYVLFGGAKCTKPLCLLVGRPGLDPGTLGLKGQTFLINTSGASGKSSNHKHLRLMDTYKSFASGKS